MGTVPLAHVQAVQKQYGALAGRNHLKGSPTSKGYSSALRAQSGAPCGPGSGEPLSSG
eukprot:CAMPEP_0170428788 /NCGR_PEP_ID=MMETSP0117_2-20130122/39958_1 /TAXON_ID=400756 /ORGANISM="Durinskia baltica, Strain CSIRO CS-38" /LENGTH=57 /DNA_ID=CAMNT_0010688107 /DNA_START=74 /DNA_END=243 /DNA_ORIENTATION=-